MWGRAASVAVLAAIAALIVVSSANAAPSWLPTVDVEPTSPLSSLVFPKVIAREAGCSSVVFPRGGVLATTRAPGGSYTTPPQVLGSDESGAYPETAFGGGVAAVTWLDFSSKLQIAMATGCQPFGAAAEVPSTPTSPNHAKVAVDSNGTTIAVVGGGAGGSRKAYVSELPAGGSPTAAAPLPIPSGEAFRPWVATNGNGGAAIVFDLIDGGDQVYGSLRSAAGWSAPVKLTEEGKTAVAETARVAIGPAGILHASWVETTSGKLIFASLTPGGSVTRTTLQEVAGGGITTEPAAAPKIAEDDQGRIGVLWVQEAAGVRTVKAKVREPGSLAFSGALNVSPTTNHPRSYPWLAIDRDGRLIATYSESPSIGHVDAWGATLDRGASAFTEPVDLGEAAHVTQPNGISTDGDGNTLVAIYKTDSPNEARVGVFDAAGPILQGLSVPGSGALGQPIPFSVSPVDAWSPLGTTVWNFGDGATATGNTTSHAFSVPGSPQITVSAGDSLGNTSEAKGSTTIQGAPGEGAPVITDLKLSRKRFRAAGSTKPVGKYAAKGSRKSPVGTKISFELSEAATVRLEIDHLGGKKYKLRRGLTAGGVIQLKGRPGSNTVHFNGKFGRRRLITGGYGLKATATDSGGNHSAPKSVTFNVVSR
jgi:hypothetical protein